MIGFQPYRGRAIRMGEGAEIYRNLKGDKKQWSVRQDGMVVGHVTDIVLLDAVPHVRLAAQRKVAAGGYRNVHAWITGRVIDHLLGGSRRVHYRPHVEGRFTYANGDTFTGSRAVLFTEDGCWDCTYDGTHLAQDGEHV